MSITYDKIINDRLLPLRYEGRPDLRGLSFYDGLAAVVAVHLPTGADDVDADELAARIRACVNACAGMKDPAAEIAALRTPKAPPGHIIDDQGNVRPVHGRLVVSEDGYVLGHMATVSVHVESRRGEPSCVGVVCLQIDERDDFTEYASLPRYWVDIGEAKAALNKENGNG